MAARWTISRETYRLARRARDALTASVHRERAEARQVPPPETRAAYRILNFALQAGAVMLSSGAGTLEVEATILDLVTACGLGRCEVDVAFTSITVSYNRGDDVEPVTAMRVVRRRALDYGRLAGVNALREDLAAGRITPDEAIAQLAEVMAAHPRDHRLVLMSWAGTLLRALALGLAIAAGVTLGRMIIYPPQRPEGGEAGAVISRSADSTQ